MKITKQEVEEELNHRKQILSALVRRRRPLELQEAQKGLNTPPEVSTEISSLAEQIRKQEEEIARLQTLAAEGQLSIVEVEFRVMVAKTWNTPNGRPSLAGANELELARLKMGLLLEKAEQIGHEVRAGLAEEVFSNLDADLLKRLPGYYKPPVVSVESDISVKSGISVKRDRRDISMGRDISMAGDVVGRDKIEIHTNYEDPYDASLRIIGRAIRLDVSTALRLFLIILPSDFLLNVDWFGNQLLNANRVWNYQTDKESFEHFLKELSDALVEREAANAQ